MEKYYSVDDKKMIAIADAIRAKTGKTEQMTVEDMPEEIGGIIGGGLNINGVIEQYRVSAGKTVNAGDFVEFVHKFGKGEFTGEINYISACKLDNNHILVAYSDITNSNYGTALIITINNNLLTIGEKVVFHSKKTVQIFASAINDNKVLISYCRCPYSMYAMAIILNIDGTNIIPSNKLELSRNSNNQVKHVYGLTHTLLSENHGLITYSWKEAGSDYYSYIVLFTIENNSIVINTTDTVSHYNNPASNNKLIKLTESSVLMLYNSSSESLMARIISINENTLSRGTAYTICSKSTTYSGAVFSENTALVAYKDANNSNVGTAIILNIQGTKITPGSSVIFYNGVTNYIATIALSENTALISYLGSAILVTYDGFDLTLGATTPLFDDASGTYKSIIPFSESSVFIFGINNNIGKYVNLSIDGYDISVSTSSGIFVKPAVTRLHDIGIAATSGADGEMVDVYTVSLPYLVTINANNVTLTQSITHLPRFEPSTITFVPNSGYELNNVIVSGCDYILDESINKITLFNPIDRVTVTIDATLLFKGGYSTAEASAGTELTSTIDCNIGDLIVAAIVTRDALTVSDGWTLVSTSEINSTDTTNGQRLSWAYKFAESTTENITVTQTSEQRLYINMVALESATGITDCGYSYMDSAATSITATKPTGLVLWGMTCPMGATGGQWAASNEMPIVQLGTDTCARLAVGLDQTNEKSVTFTCGSESTMIVGCLTVQGMDKFYTDNSYDIGV